MNRLEDQMRDKLRDHSLEPRADLWKQIEKELHAGGDTSQRDSTFHEKLEQQMRDKLHGHHIEPSAKVWKNIEKELRPAAAGRVFELRTLRRYAAAAAVALVAVAGWWALGSDNNGQQMANTATEPSKPATETTVTTPKPSATPQQPVTEQSVAMMPAMQSVIKKIQSIAAPQPEKLAPATPIVPEQPAVAQQNTPAPQISPEPTAKARPYITPLQPLESEAIAAELFIIERRIPRAYRADIRNRPMLADNGLPTDVLETIAKIGRDVRQPDTDASFSEKLFNSLKENVDLNTVAAEIKDRIYGDDDED